MYQVSLVLLGYHVHATDMQVIKTACSNLICGDPTCDFGVTQLYLPYLAGDMIMPQVGCIVNANVIINVMGLSGARVQSVS